MYIMDNDLKLQDWEFSQRKHLPYEVKLILSTERIWDWYDYYNGMVYISFSGRLDSTALVHMVEHVLERSVPKVFVDTGLEFPEIKEFVNSFDVEVRYPECSFRNVILERGYPLRNCKKITLNIALNISSSVQVKKRRHSELC